MSVRCGVMEVLGAGLARPVGRQAGASPTMLAEPVSSNLQPSDGLLDAGRGPAVLAGGDAGEGDELAPAEGGSGGGELLGDSSVVLLGVQGAVLADGVAEQEAEDGPGGLVQRADAVDDGAGA